MAVSYTREIRAKAKQAGRKLFTIGIEKYGLVMQGMADDALSKDLFDAVMRHKERRKIAREQEKPE